MRGATEDEQPVHFLQRSPLYLAQWTSLIQPAKSLLDQPSAVQSDSVSEELCGSSIQVLRRPLSFFVKCACLFLESVCRHASENRACPSKFLVQ